MRFKTTLKNSNTLIDLTPLVDVIFLMLIFFIVTSDILPLKSLNIENPRLTENTEPLTTQLLVVMDAQQVLYLGSKKSIVEMSSIKELLLQEISDIRKRNGGSLPAIVLSIDHRVDYGAFLKLFAMAQECGCPLRLVYQPHEAEDTEYL